MGKELKNIMKGDGKSLMKNITKRVLVALVVAAMAFLMPLASLADTLENDHQDGGYQEVMNLLGDDGTEAPGAEAEDTEVNEPDNDAEAYEYEDFGALDGNELTEECEFCEEDPCDCEAILYNLINQLAKIRGKVEGLIYDIEDDPGEFPHYDPIEFQALSDEWLDLKLEVFGDSPNYFSVNDLIFALQGGTPVADLLPLVQSYMHLLQENLENTQIVYLGLHAMGCDDCGVCNPRCEHCDEPLVDCECEFCEHCNEPIADCECVCEHCDEPIADCECEFCEHCNEPLADCECVCEHCNEPLAECECVCEHCDEPIADCECEFCELCDEPIADCECVCEHCNEPIAECECVCEHCDEPIADCECEFCEHCDEPIADCECEFCEHCDEPLADCECEFCEHCDELLADCECEFCEICDERKADCVCVDRAPLTNAIRLARARVATNYTDPTWRALQDVLSRVLIVYANEDATQAQIHQAALDLLTAIAGLQRLPVQPPPVTVNRLPLRETIGTASIRVQANYTSATWAAFAVALAHAQAVYADPEATQAQIYAARDTLEHFMGELHRVTPRDDRPAPPPAPAAAGRAPQTGDYVSMRIPLAGLMMSLFALSGLSVMKAKKEE